MKAASHKQSAISFLQLASSGKARQAFDTYASPELRHHNPYFRGDAESLMTAVAENAKKFPGKTFDVQHSLEDADLVAVHSRVRLKPEEPGMAVVHVFRFDGDRIAELWDIGQPVRSESANANGMF
jgi:predicted SnoaL-like aldol condensation-catalyzing enzyme